MSDDSIKNALVVVAAVAGYSLWAGLWSCHYASLAIFTIAVYFISGYNKRRHLRMLWRDVRCLTRLIRIGIFLKKMQKNEETIPKKFKEVCTKNPNKVMFYLGNEAWSFQKVDEFSNQVANCFSARGVGEGDNVALFMETRVEYVPLWLGLQKIGASVALINSNLTGSPLAHSLQAVPLKGIIYGPEVEPALDGIEVSIAEVPLYKYGAADQNEPSKSACNSRAVDLSTELASTATTSPAAPGTKHHNTALYVFTSGTTGMPKAVVITHGRYIATTLAAHMYIKMRGDDIVYVPLPLYHTNGGTLGVGQALLAGLTVALRKKFSTSNFWRDCIRYNCTSFVYIGELCRYLLAAPQRLEDRQHSVRLILGNGLRPLIWEQFIKRFGISQVAEFYGSSEGIGSLMNTEGKVGAVGHIPLLWPDLVPIYLVKIDPETEMPLRDSRGRCIRVSEPGVPGMHVSKIISNRVGQDFEGYADSAATKKKVIQDVFRAGDRYYVSGDVFTMDEEQFIYFQDRTGDTFRWRGENVSTTEVEQVISDIIELKDAAVYGVEIPGVEGKAGMAAICDPNSVLNLANLNQGLSQRLPKYARPLFLRLLQKIQLTETYKIKKKQLKEDGYNPDVVSDKLYYYNGQQDNYLELTKEVYDGIKNGSVVFYLVAKHSVKCSGILALMVALQQPGP